MRTASTSSSKRRSVTCSGKSKRSSANELTRKRLEVELRQAKELARLEEEAERKRLVRPQEIVRLQAQQELVCNISEEEEDEESNAGSSERSAVSKVRSWIGSAQGDLDERAEIGDHGRGTQNRPTLSRRPGRTAAEEEDHDNSGMRRYIARQAMGQDLPTFSGEISEWTLFISTFRSNRSLQVLRCGEHDSS